MGKFTPFAFILDQWTRLPPPLSVDLSRKTVVVIGANTGIGFETAKHFARMKPARLVLGCRSEAKGKQALERIAQDTGYAAELEIIDLAEFRSVIEFAQRLRNAPVDYLIANAGVAPQEYKLTADTWEQSIQVNHLATALLSLLLVPNMVKAAQEQGRKARLVIACSELHFLANFDKIAAAPHILQELNKVQDMAPRYQETKLLNVFFTRALADHLPPTVPVIPTTVNPGFCYSEIRRDFTGRMKLFTKMMEIVLGRTAEQGARQLIWAALGPDGKDGHHVKHLRGAYVSTLAVQEPSDYVLSKEGYEMQERIWRETVEVLESVSPEAQPIFKQYFTG